MGGSYSAEISRDHPTCFLFLLDQSYSMTEPCAGDEARPKANAAADAINNLIRTLIIRCTKNAKEGPRNYYEVGVIGYGSARGVGPCFSKALRGMDLVPTRHLASNPLRVENRTRQIPDGAGRLTEVTVRFPVWFDPVAEADTPMREAMQYAHKVLRQWTSGHKKSFPPMVINITDGMPNEDPRDAARALTSLSVDDGNVLLYNLHLSMLKHEPIMMPAQPNTLPDEFATMLFEMSSVFPEKIRQEFEIEGYNVPPGSRGFVFNMSADVLVRFIEVGTRTALNRLASGEPTAR